MTDTTQDPDTISANAGSIVSPCVLVCQIDMEAGHCYGCGRTIDEITGWASFTDAKRNEMMAALPDRVAALPKRERRVTKRQRQRQRTRET